MPLPRIAILIDLPREAASGGHVKYWERVAQAAAKEDARADLTFYFSGAGADEILSPHVRFRFLPPVFSTARLKFLPYVPAHTDLAPFHPRLAQELENYDVLHTTDAFFAFARTAERVARWRGIALMTSFHTDTPAYAELFTRQTLQNLLGEKGGGWIDGVFKISARERARKEKRLKTHIAACDAVLAMRAKDVSLARGVVAADRVRTFRLAVDKELFALRPGARAAVERDYGIPPGKFLVLFVGRVDAGKNIPVLVKACADAIAEGAALHLLVAGVGPLENEVRAALGAHATLAGFVAQEKLAQFYEACDCLAIASEIEIGGMIGLEALACGRPVLVSRKSDIAQICGEPPAMQMVESGREAWAAALLNLARDRARQAAMRAAACVFREYNIADWGEVLDQDFMPVWQDLARRRKA